ncbi:MAG: anthranilate synthase component I [Methanosarcina thermophila]|jgi:anthranilate synthase component 1|uniref:Anthranilate synthase component 1 n=3 Tax=Methanosarcina thermophila TaxID=2210 RepID=A0A1I6ZYG7_METTE|nr:anthranilate synthase component I [Methanosarcina thermophila]ALK06127.1 MAG: anthranilate synthase [Methanosarcina sp. 795]AKB12266.1 Anthranilate synthase, aminase component [Methanosarcina thermophila TM-1]AKB14531.1 Anthranilate synthase, aminase component [Methanosarcina thermophila CHTI-55]NLU56452.1 anthranilate synthase component I [Methanosarcina thermophila]SFT67695.1 anthranilate synthase, component I [Methanosarcina thermophila]
MLSFDLGKEEFKALASGISQPVFIQLLARIDAITCSPLELYRTLRNSGKSGYSYLLESVEKQASRARYSFVGSDPDAVIEINDRRISLELLNSDALPFFEEVRSKIKEACGSEAVKEEKQEKDNSGLKNIKLTAPIPHGKDAFDGLRLVFPPANGLEILNARRFDRQTFLGGAIGYTAYDAIYDSWLGVEKGFESEIPELQYLLVSKTFIFDHVAEEVFIVLTPFVNPDSDAGEIYEKALQDAEKLYSMLKETSFCRDSIKTGLSGAVLDAPESSGLSAFECRTGEQEFKKSVLQAKEHIFAGDIFQAVLSRKLEFRLEQTPFEIYMRLRSINPSPYMYIFEFRDLAIVGASPETLLTVHKRTVIINPIAGTCPRGKTEAEDEAFALRMLHDEKERAEHVMLVDLGRNDVRMVAESGSVKVSEFMKVLKYSHVQHIESTVSGKLRPECDQFDAFRAVFPAGTLSGAPKIRAMEIISKLETSPRGIYGGGVGYYSWNGDADFAIVIRTVLVKGNRASVQAGAGIVADSDPEYEFRETERKMAAMLAAIGGENYIAIPGLNT